MHKFNVEELYNICGLKEMMQNEDITICSVGADFHQWMSEF